MRRGNVQLLNNPFTHSNIKIDYPSSRQLGIICNKKQNEFLIQCLRTNSSRFKIENELLKQMICSALWPVLIYDTHLHTCMSGVLWECPLSVGVCLTPILSCTRLLRQACLDFTSAVTQQLVSSHFLNVGVLGTMRALVYPSGPAMSWVFVLCWLISSNWRDLKSPRRQISEHVYEIELTQVGRPILNIGSTKP